MPLDRIGPQVTGLPAADTGEECGQMGLLQRFGAIAFPKVLDFLVLTIVDRPAGGVAQGQGGTAGQAQGKTQGRTQGKGSGLFRRGADGSAAGARGGRKADERTEQRDALVYEQDWLGDESAGTGVLD